MPKVPCILCNRLSEAIAEQVVAKICSHCSKGSLYKILNNVKSKQVREVLKNNKNRLTITDNGEII
jgi:hypothetical protein